MIIPKKNSGGYVMLLNTVLFIAILLAVLSGVSNIVLSHYASTQGLSYSNQSYYTAHSAISEAYYRLKNGLYMPPSVTVNLASGSSTVNVVTTSTGKTITVSGAQKNYQRNLQMDLSLGTGIAFHYGIQSGNGGFFLNNSSSVVGNVFSSGPVTGSSNTIYGDVVSAGPTGLISGIIATGTIYAHTLQNSSAGKDAYYANSGTIDSYTGTHVTGTKYPNSADQPVANLPITDAQIADWETQAAVTVSSACSGGTYSISSNITLGPLKIPCNLSISGNGTKITVAGPIWVVGNITTSNSPVIAMSPFLGTQNVAIIADNPSASTTSSLISLNNNTSFQGSGSAGSFVFMISQNGSAENGGSTNAISVGQSSTALVGYAIHGLISLGQSVQLKEATAYKISLANSANVTYDRGLPNTLFSAGPGGGYDVIDWLEI